MRCEYCQHEFAVYDERQIGSNVICPSCGAESACSDRRILIFCPECKRELECELWMLGSTAECSFCGCDIVLSRPYLQDGSNTNSYLPSGYKLGNYTIISCVGAGGMGEVYLAHHDLLDRRCALKLLRPDLQGTVANVSLEALVREAQLACRLRCPNIIEVMDVQIDRKRNFGYIVMEFVQGNDVESMINGTPMNEDSVLNIARGVTLALVEASKFQIVHRDIKPGNIMITGTGEIKLADLGIAKSGNENAKDTGGRITGTVHYAAPEQLMDPDGGDARSDIYSLGATMYNMLSGKRPFDGSSLRAVLSLVLKAEFEPLDQAAPGVSKETCKLVSSMMAYSPEKRPQNARELLLQLDRIIAIRSGKISFRKKLLDTDKIKKFFIERKRQFIIGSSIAGAVLLLILIASLIFSSASSSKTSGTPQTAAAGVQQKTVQFSGDHVNFIKLLLLAVWILSGIKVLKFLSGTGAQQSELAVKYGAYLNFAALAAGPLVYLAVKFDERYTDRIRAFMQRLEKLPCIVDSQGNMIYQDDEYAEDFEVVHFLRQIIAKAVTLRAGEIIIETANEGETAIRLRVDGALRNLEKIDSEFAYMLINTVRAVSGMNVSDRYRFQNGAFSITGSFGDISFRASAGRDFSGERAVLRIIDNDSAPQSIADMGLDGRELMVMENVSRLPSGLVLICGPSDSGKTSSFYAILNSIDSSGRSIISIESPIERVIPEIKQIEVRENAGKSFAKLLHEAILMRPDVICLSEINDPETAGLAVDAAQNGILVIATMNANDKVSVFERLINFGLPLHSIAGALRVVVSQRLLRNLCKCKKHTSPTPDQQFSLNSFELKYSTLYTPSGCSKCGKTGYSGRSAIFDILTVDDDLRLLLEDDRTNLSNIQRRLEQSGRNHEMIRSGYSLVVRGITSIEEVERVTMEL